VIEKNTNEEIIEGKLEVEEKFEDKFEEKNEINPEVVKEEGVNQKEVDHIEKNEELHKEPVQSEVIVSIEVENPEVQVLKGRIVSITDVGREPEVHENINDTDLTTKILGEPITMIKGVEEVTEEKKNQEQIAHKLLRLSQKL